MLRVDHVVRAVRDLDEAGRDLLDAYGLRSVPGGVHPRWGTGNRIVPLGTTYLELLAVVDPEAARSTTLGRALLDRTADGDRWFAVCLADDDIERTAARLGLAVEAGSRTRPDGAVVAWRGAGIEDPRRTADLPFFITWDVPGAHPGADPPEHPSGARSIAWVEIAGDRARFEAWTGGADLPARFVETGPVGVRAVGLRTDAGELMIA